MKISEEEYKRFFSDLEFRNVPLPSIELLDGTKAYLHALIDNSQGGSWPGPWRGGSLPPGPAGSSWRLAVS